MGKPTDKTAVRAAITRIQRERGVSYREACAILGRNSQRKAKARREREAARRASIETPWWKQRGAEEPTDY